MKVKKSLFVRIFILKETIEKIIRIVKEKRKTNIVKIKLVFFSAFPVCDMHCGRPMVVAKIWENYNGKKQRMLGQNILVCPACFHCLREEDNWEM